jgi:hypothetical protein
MTSNKDAACRCVKLPSRSLVLDQNQATCKFKLFPCMNLNPLLPSLVQIKPFKLFSAGPFNYHHNNIIYVLLHQNKITCKSKLFPCVNQNLLLPFSFSTQSVVETLGHMGKLLFASILGNKLGYPKRNLEPVCPIKTKLSITKILIRPGIYI